MGVQGGVRSTRLGVAEEGCVVSCDGALSTTAVSKLGLAFVVPQVTAFRTIGRCVSHPGVCVEERY